ncbi:MAG: hypothetical protein II931_02350 [Clostridia bacterium]|nr:hypothetical protein [Clostridia bacterium]
MGKEFYQPANNYERNFLMVKRFGGRISLLMIPILLFISIVCSCYLNIIDQPHLEITIIKVVTSKLNFNLKFGGYETMFLMSKILLSGFFIFTLMYIFIKSKNSDFDSTPDLGFALIHKISLFEIIVSALAFVTMIAVTGVFMFGNAERFESLGAVFYLTVTDLEAYKVTITIMLLLIDTILFLMIWFSQAQTDFMKSVRQSLVESVPRNKGAHTYGVFSMVLAIIFTTLAGILTFMYYCYQDAFSGFGITMDKTYVYVSLLSAYINGLVPFLLAVNAFAYSAMVDELNTIGTLIYNNFEVIGDAEDPNMNR